VARSAACADDEGVIVRSAVPALRNRLLRRLSREDGFTLVELLASMSIMLLVISGLASVFVAG